MSIKKNIAVLCLCQMAQAQTALEVTETIKKNLNVAWNEKTVDTFKAGNPNEMVSGVACTFMATLEVLKKAKAAGCNFVITHEPTFYGHLDDVSIHANDPVQQEKLKFIEDNHMVVWRFHDHLHAHKPDMIYVGVAEKMGWAPYWSAGSLQYSLPVAKSLKEIAQELKKVSKAKTIRVVGAPSQQISKVGLVLGAAGSAAHFRMLKNADCQLLIVGESNEWETVPYVQDAISEGYNKALIVLGHADSEEWGMKTFSAWLQKLYPTKKVKFIEAGNPYWAP